MSNSYHDGKQMPTQQELRDLFDYDDSLGALRWKVARQRINVGDVAGYMRKDGYTVVGIDGELYLAHRLIWVYHNGEIPAGVVIDHKVSEEDQPKDNRLENLQLATQRDNIFKRKKQSNNTSGLPGVSWHKGTNKWQAQYQNESGGQTYIGLYTNKYEAYHNAAEASAKVAGDFYTEKQLSVQDRHNYIDWLIDDHERNCLYSRDLFKLAA